MDFRFIAANKQVYSELIAEVSRILESLHISQGIFPQLGDSRFANWNIKNFLKILEREKR